MRTHSIKSRFVVPALILTLAVGLPGCLPGCIGGLLPDLRQTFTLVDNFTFGPIAGADVPVPGGISTGVEGFDVDSPLFPVPSIDEFIDLARRIVGPLADRFQPVAINLERLKIRVNVGNEAFRSIQRIDLFLLTPEPTKARLSLGSITPSASQGPDYTFIANPPVNLINLVSGASPQLGLSMVLFGTTPSENVTLSVDATGSVSF